MNVNRGSSFAAEKRAAAAFHAPALRHGRGVRPEMTRNALRSQKTASSIFQLFDEEDVGGMRSDTLSEAQGVQPCTAKRVFDCCPLIAPLPQMLAEVDLILPAFFRDPEVKNRKGRAKEKEEKKERKK